MKNNNFLNDMLILFSTPKLPAIIPVHNKEILKILKKGWKICKVPINFYGRKFAEGKKMDWADGVGAVYYLLKYRLAD